MKLPSIIKFADEKLCEAFYNLEKGDYSEKELFKAIRKALDAIESNAFCGIQIPKRQITKNYIKKYEIENLWKYNLPGGWRLIYSITKGDILVISLIIEYLEHRAYERKFNYTC